MSRRANASAIAGWRGAAYKACQVIRRMIIAPFLFLEGDELATSQHVFRAICAPHQLTIAWLQCSMASRSYRPRAVMEFRANCLALGKLCSGRSQVRDPTVIPVLVTGIILPLAPAIVGRWISATSAGMTRMLLARLP